MNVNIPTPSLSDLLTKPGILSFFDVRSQPNDTTKTLNFPFPHEGVSWYDVAELRFETDKPEAPADLVKKNFQRGMKMFELFCTR